MKKKNMYRFHRTLCIVFFENKIIKKASSSKGLTVKHGSLHTKEIIRLLKQYPLDREGKIFAKMHSS